MLKRQLPWIALSLGALAVLVISIFFDHTANPPEFVLLRSWPAEKPSLRDRIDVLIPRQRSWAWAWHAEEFVFGKRKTVDIGASVFSFQGSTAEKCVTDMGPPAFSVTDRIDVWLLSTNQITALKKNTQNLGGPQLLNRAAVSTAYGMQAQVFCGESRGTNPVISAGMQMDFLAYARKARADLIVGALYSEFQTNAGSGNVSPEVSVLTNLNTLFRIQVPSGKGVLMINNDRNQTNRFGLMLDLL